MSDKGEDNSEQIRQISQGIINISLKMMENIITQKSPKKRALSWSKSHKQSKTGIVSNTILFNIFINNQRLPARPIDFRLNFGEEEKDIGESELTNILKSIVRKQILNNKRGRFPYPRGRPPSYMEERGLAEEKRGADSSYEPTEIKDMIDELLQDADKMRPIENAIMKSDLFTRFLRYCIEAQLYHIKNEKAFRNTLKPAIMKYRLQEKRKEELGNSWIYPKALTPEKIKQLSEAYAIEAINKFKEDGKNIFFFVAMWFYVFDVYNSKDGRND